MVRAAGQKKSYSSAKEQPSVYFYSFRFARSRRANCGRGRVCHIHAAGCRLDDVSRGKTEADWS